MRPGTRFFRKDDGTELPVHEDYLMPFLSPTKEGSHFRESPPEADISDRQQGRVLLQIHQILSLFQSHGIRLEGKTLLDIGTGNGLVPCMMLELSGLKSAIGADPYLDGEHLTSWQVHDHNEALRDIKGFLDRFCPETIDYEAYRYLLKYENYSLVPSPVRREKYAGKPYRFAQVGAHESHRLDERFDVFYCKAIEHIPDWDGVFRSAAEASNDGAVFYLKHRSFFSFLGPHRYSTVDIPWGHLLLKDDEYKRFVEEFHPRESKKMVDFYFRGLSYPRTTVPEMVRIAAQSGFVPVTVICEPTRYIEQVTQLIAEVPDFWKIVSRNFPQLGADEIFSGMHHIIFRKVKR